MRDKTSLLRQWGLLKALSCRRLGISISAMVDEMGVSRKTIRRDLDLFRSAGFPLEESVGEFGRKTWKLANPGQHVPLSFEKIKHYKVDRIDDVEVSTFPFQRPKDFDLSAHLARSFGIFHGHGDITVKIRFARKVARYVSEGRWHHAQRLTKQRDGSLLAEFRPGSTAELKRWILSFGGKAVVLEPESLRLEIAEEIEAMVAAYTEPRRDPHPRPNQANRAFRNR